MADVWPSCNDDQEANYEENGPWCSVKHGRLRAQESRGPAGRAKNAIEEERDPSKERNCANS